MSLNYSPPLHYGTIDTCNPLELCKKLDREGEREREKKLFNEAPVK